MALDGDRRVGNAALRRHLALALDMDEISDLHRRRALRALHAPMRARRVVDEEELQVVALERHHARKVGRRGIRGPRDKSEN